VYGIPASVPIREDAALGPINPYGETKRTFEGALRWYAAAYGLRSVSLRYFNVAGASARNGEAHDPETHLIPNVIAAAEGRAEVTVFGTDYPTPDGTCIRDYIHVTDLAAAHGDALRHLRAGGDNIVANCGYGRGFSVLEVIDTVKRVSGRDFPVKVGARRPGDPSAIVASPALIMDRLGWRPKHADLDGIVGSALLWEEALSRRNHL
jgi:UDP-glucose 4-epimerase